jgi:hypothetical protein
MIGITLPRQKNRADRRRLDRVFRGFWEQGHPPYLHFFDRK